MIWNFALTLQWVSWMSSCWNMYAVMKQNNSDRSGKPTVARHSFRNDSARYMELLLLPTLFSSILAVLFNILAFVRKAMTCNSEQSPVRQLCGIDSCCSPAFNLFHDPWHYVPDEKKSQIAPSHSSTYLRIDH